MRKNSQVAKILYEIAELLEIQNVRWKPQAYRKAAQTIENLKEDIAKVAKEGKLDDLPGVGEHIAIKIEEIVKTGKLKYLKDLRKKVPIDVQKLSQIEGVGPKTIKLLHKELKVKDVKSLKKAAKGGKLQRVKGLGKKTEDQILASIGQIEKRGPIRMLLGEVTPIAEEIVQILKKVPGATKVQVAGSYRRGRETLGDLDILVASSKPKKVMDIFTSMSGVKRVIARGSTKSSILLDNGLQVDVRVVKKEQYGSALQYFTGSKEHSVRLRKLALKKGLTLSEYGLARFKTKKIVAGKTEEEVYKRLGLQYIPPEMREDRGELELALKKNLPKLVEYKHIKGDFQTQTKWSDGNDSILELAKAAQARGWKHLVITDHVGGIGIANPLDEKRLIKQGKEINKVNKKLDIHVFKGAEIDIKKNGQLALSKKACEKLDVVLASIHSSFRLSNKDMTKRLVSAMEDFPVHVFGHPSARLINKRSPIDFNIEKVFQTAKDNNVFLEVNGQPSRMDLRSSHILEAKDIGCKFVLSTDAHSKDNLDFMKYAVITARRGWLEKKDILNTKTIAQIKKALR